MRRQILRTAAVAVLSAAAAAVCMVAAFSARSELVLEMDRDLPRRLATGLYRVERAGLDTFVWTAERADFAFSGLPRRAPWTCTVRVRGARGEPLPQPEVEVLVDGLRRATILATNDYQDVDVVAPPRPGRPGLTLSVSSSTTMMPGPHDPRTLGVQLDRIACEPQGGWIVWPPNGALGAAMAAGAMFGGMLVLAGGAAPAALVAATLISGAQSWALVAGVAPYGDFPGVIVRLAFVIAALALASVWLLEVGLRKPLTGAARFVVLFSACVLYVKLIGLLHPGKLVIDALFHAHRFQAVLAGNYYFTQQMPGGVSFPYAIALYLFAAPWSYFTRDYVSLLRIVVTASEVVAGGLLYVLIVRTWGNRVVGPLCGSERDFSPLCVEPHSGGAHSAPAKERSGAKGPRERPSRGPGQSPGQVAALAVVIFHLVPLPWGLIGNANMTNAFGQSVALGAVIAATLFRADRPVQIAGLFVVAAFAFLAHISTAAVLGVTLVAAAVLFRVFGDRPVRRAGWVLLAVTIAAAMFSIATYYGHFAEVYRTLDRVRGVAVSTAAEIPAVASDRVPPAAPAPTPLPTRATQALVLSAAVTGWPIVVLAALGTWRVWRMRSADRLGLVLVAWAAAFVTFFAIGILPRVDVQFERYAAEFVGRVVFATYPAAVVLAAAGAAWGLRTGPAIVRPVTIALLAWATIDAARQWSGWF